jgi:hypothetical protein
VEGAALICPHCKQPLELDEVCARCGQELPAQGYKLRRVPGVGRKGKRGYRKRKVCLVCAEFLDTHKQTELFVVDGRGQELVRPERRRKRAAA